MVWDLDNHKALGLKLKLFYRRENFEISGGTYLFTSKYTDRVETVVMNTDTNRLRYELTDTWSADIYQVSADLKLRLFGFTAQAEYVHSYYLYSAPKAMPMNDPARPLMTGDLNPSHSYYGPSNSGFAYYVLLSYELPLSKWFGRVRVTPYFVFEEYELNDTRPYQNATNIWGGINVRPVSNLVFKLESGWGRTKDASVELAGKELISLSAQIAVAF